MLPQETFPVFHNLYLKIGEHVMASGYRNADQLDIYMWRCFDISLQQLSRSDNILSCPVNFLDGSHLDFLSEAISKIDATSLREFHEDFLAEMMALQKWVLADEEYSLDSSWDIDCYTKNISDLGLLFAMKILGGNEKMETQVQTSLLKRKLKEHDFLASLSIYLDMKKNSSATDPLVEYYGAKTFFGCGNFVNGIDLMKELVRKFPTNSKFQRTEIRFQIESNCYTPKAITKRYEDIIKKDARYI